MKNISESNVISRLELALFNLMNSLVGMPKYTKIKNKVLSINRKLRITRELADAKYIAIAGTQSAGKTRLIREMYDLDHQWLSDNEGRGEQLPLLLLNIKNVLRLTLWLSNIIMIENKKGKSLRRNCTRF